VLSKIRAARLRTDFEKAQSLAAASPLLDIRAVDGDPPDHYLLEFGCRTLVKPAGGSLGETDRHLVEIYLPAGYPRLDPPIVLHGLPAGVFHPNISVHPGKPRIICVGRFLQEHLDAFIWRIFNVLAARNFSMHERQSLNHEAAAYYRSHQEQFPTDTRSLLPCMQEVPSSRTEVVRKPAETAPQDVRCKPPDAGVL
jgi:hypothetical protein